MKKITSFVAALCCTMFLTATAETYSGACGENLNWSLNTETGVLDITGSGEMYDYYYDSPWGEYRNNILSVNLPNGLTYIGNEAFVDCSNLTSITIPENVIELGHGIFGGCTSLSSVIWNAKDAKRRKDDYDSRIFAYDMVAPHITSFTIGNNVEALPNNLCNKMSISSIIIPENVKETGFGIFYGCSELKTVIWNAKNVKMTDEKGDSYSIFDENSNITTFTFGNNVEMIPDVLCSHMSKLSAVTIPSSVKTIGKAAFSWCNSLQVINFLGTNVKEIGNSAFSGCSSITSFNLPVGIESLGGYVFESCAFQSITIPKSVKSIGAGAFAYNTHLKSVTILNPNAICDGDDMFNRCDSLTTYVGPASALDIDITRIDRMPSHVKEITVTGGELTESSFDFITHSYRTILSLDCGAATNTALSDEAFKGCYNLQSLILPQNLTYVSYMAVAGCKNLKSIDIPASVEEIEQSAFEDCRSLEELTFGAKKPESNPGRHFVATAKSQLRRIGNWAFYNAHELQHLEIPEGVEEIGDAAFYGCTYLQDLRLPSTIKYIGDNCFALCSKLQQITITAIIPPIIKARTFYDVSRAIPVYVLDEVVEAYLDAPYWQDMNIMGGAMAIDGVMADNSIISDGKVIRDGHIFILRDGKTYTVQGQEVK